MSVFSQVTRPDEMDCMFFPGNISEDWMEIDFHGAPPGFCFVKLKKLSELDSKYEGLKGLCEASTMRINATKFKKMTFKLFKNGIENTRNAKGKVFSMLGSLTVHGCNRRSQNTLHT